MRKALFIVLAGILLASCGAPAATPNPPTAATPTATPQPTNTPLPPTDTQIPPTATTTNTPVPSPTVTPAPSITHIYAFGDDFSDNGNRYNYAKERFEKNEIPEAWMEYWDSIVRDGRLSNGPLAVEVLADLLNAGLTDYAYVGAYSGYESNDSDKLGLMWQVEKMESELKDDQVDPKALVYIQIGGNDFTQHVVLEDDFSDEAVTEHADEVVANISSAVTRLAEAGAKQFLVLNAFDWANAPIFVDPKYTDYAGWHEPLTVFQDRISSTLPDALDELAGQLNVEISVFDTLAAGEQIKRNASQYGITHLTDPCTDIPDNPDEECESPDEYYYWNSWMFTHRINQLLAEAMAEQLSK